MVVAAWFGWVELVVWFSFLRFDAMPAVLVLVIDGWMVSGRAFLSTASINREVHGNERNKLLDARSTNRNNQPNSNHTKPDHKLHHVSQHTRTNDVR